MKHRRLHPLLILAVIGSLLLGACSREGDEEADDTPASTEPSTEADGAENEGTTEDTAEVEDEGESAAETEGETAAESEGKTGEPVEVGEGGQPYVDALVTSIQQDEEFPIDDANAECVATRFVDTLDPDRLQEAGITPEAIASDEDSMDFSALGLSEDEGNVLYDHFGDCGVDLRQVMVDSLAADEDMTPEQRLCMEAVFTEENLRAFMVIGLTEGDAGFEEDTEAGELMGGLMACAFMGLDAELETEPAEAGRG